MENKKKIDQKENVPWWQPGILLFAQLSGWIVAPIIIAVYLGKWLDQRYGTKPWLFLLTVIIAFVISMVGIVREAMAAINKIEEINKKDEQNKK